MTEEIAEEVVAPVTDTETSGEESEPSKPEQVTQPEENVEQTDETFTKAQVEEMFDKRTARMERKLRREREANQPKAEPEKPKGEPNIDDYEDTTQWIKDRTDWAADQAAKRERASYEQSAQEREAEKVNSAYQKQQKEAEKVHPDYWDAIESLEDYGKIPDHLNASVVQSEVGGELSYFLGKNPEELDKLVDLDPIAAVKAIARLEDKLTSTPAKEISKVPAPAPKSNTGGRTESLEYRKDMTHEDFIKLRNKELGRN